jgi:hypothetical protein
MRPFRFVSRSRQTGSGRAGSQDKNLFHPPEFTGYYPAKGVAMPEKELLKKNKELMATLVKLRAEIALAQATLDTAHLYSKSIAARFQQMQAAMENIKRRTGPKGVLAQTSKTDDAFMEELAEIHEIAVHATKATDAQPSRAS